VAEEIGHALAAYIILLLLCLGGIFITLLGLPGLWVMVLAALLYAWYTSFHYIGLWTIVILIIIAAIAELIEFLAGSRGAKKGRRQQPRRVGGTDRRVIRRVFF